MLLPLLLLLLSMIVGFQQQNVVGRTSAPLFVIFAWGSCGGCWGMGQIHILLLFVPTLKLVKYDLLFFGTIIKL